MSAKVIIFLVLTNAAGERMELTRDYVVHDPQQWCTSWNAVGYEKLAAHFGDMDTIEAASCSIAGRPEAQR